MKAIIIGSGPAGISASLYLVRSGIATTVVSSGKSALLKTVKIENYYGFPNAIDGQTLYENGINQAKNLGVEFVEDEIFTINYEGKFILTGKNGKYEADGIVLATGADRSVPNIDGLRALEGRGVSYCAICDAFFFRNKNVAVLGNGEYALHEANDIKSVAKSVTILTNGKDLDVEFPSEFKIDKRKIEAFCGDTRLTSVLFSDDEELEIDGVFIAVGVAGTTALARKLGAKVELGQIYVDENMKTSVKNVYACGDCTGGLLQISKAVYEGATAGTELAYNLKMNQTTEKR